MNLKFNLGRWVGRSVSWLKIKGLTLGSSVFYSLISNDIYFSMSFVCFQCLKCTSLHCLQNLKKMENKKIWNKFYSHNLVAN
jgi:hypothetical protein